ncbi:hypothetical protein FMUND_12862 [Fusarium mundagurra]|uniref:Uncharacterized protein n=1 Tax=Fusarium mundagurra TaxID=1567541 RepID=A0A8H5Y1Z6_9HYPO|nr:hypothetical protein FMUND_12862 [Fusarium mundagurra]
MDDPLWTWPAWKFDMKTEDLVTKLHDQYNTYPVPIQDTEAFYHDISEISYEAQSTAEFHHLASHRRQQRLCELNKSLESASVEIIGNPNLIKMPQWEHAVQLFRTNSLDSLVRYFASYLPIDHIWHPSCHDSALAATHTFSTSSLPKKRCKRTKINKTFGAGGQTLLSSSMVLGRLPAKDQPLEADKLFDSTRPAVLSSFSELGIKHTRPQEYSPYVGHGGAAVSSGDGMSTIPDYDTFTTVECRIKHTLNETGLFDKRLSTRLSLEQIDLASNHSGGQRSRCVGCQVSARPKILTSSPANLSFPGPLRTPVASDDFNQGAAGGTVGLKRKRC